MTDFGTSATAEGKVRVKWIAGQPSPDGWLLDSEGRPTNDSKVLYVDPPGTIRPFGGEQAYKGFALGMMVELFAARWREPRAFVKCQRTRRAIACSRW